MSIEVALSAPAAPTDALPEAPVVDTPVSLPVQPPVQQPPAAKTPTPLAIYLAAVKKASADFKTAAEVTASPNRQPLILTRLIRLGGA